MGVTLQAGFLASCVVFGPMAMAGWHLTRNRVLFFSGSLFIALAVSVHVFPYFPALALPATATATTPSNHTLRAYCVSNLHNVEFAMAVEGEARNGTEWDFWEWRWDAELLRRCKYQKLARSEALELLRGTWIVVAGDSQARLLFLALLELLLPSIDDVRPHLFKRHSNFEYSLSHHRILMEFVWAPYTINVTRLVIGYGEHPPDLFVASAGLWHMLHNGNHSQFGASLGSLKHALGAVSGHRAHPQLFWINLPSLVPALYQNQLKRERMTTQKLELYTAAIAESEIAGVATLLDVQALSSRCGAGCTQDGIHYSRAVYRAAVHFIVNHLLIVTKQTPIT